MKCKQILITQLIKTCSEYDETCYSHPNMEEDERPNSFDDIRYKALRLLPNKSLEKLIADIKMRKPVLKKD